MSNFIERDFDSVFDLLDLRRLLPLLGRVNLLELLGNHHERCAEHSIRLFRATADRKTSIFWQNRGSI